MLRAPSFANRPVPQHTATVPNIPVPPSTPPSISRNKADFSEVGPNPTPTPAQSPSPTPEQAPPPSPATQPPPPPPLDWIEQQAPLPIAAEIRQAREESGTRVPGKAPTPEEAARIHNEKVREANPDTTVNGIPLAALQLDVPGSAPDAPGSEKGADLTPVELAYAFAEDANYLKGRNVQSLLKFDNIWYKWWRTKYVRVGRAHYKNDEAETTVKRMVSDWLLNHYPHKHTTHYIREIMTVLSSATLFGTYKTQAPFFLAHKHLEGEIEVEDTCMDAKAWTVFQNKRVMQDRLIDALAEGEEAPADAVRDTGPDLFTLDQLPYDFDPDAECPVFMRYLRTTQPDPEMQAYLQLIAGLLIQDLTTYQVFFLLYGRAGSGKSTFMDIMRELVGRQNTCSVALANLADRFKVHALTCHKLNIDDDVNDTDGDDAKASRNMGHLKKVASAAWLFSEKKNEDAVEAKITARCLYATNVLPSLPDMSNAVWRRLRIVPFNQPISESGAVEKDLLELIRPELAGVYNWALQGAARLRALSQFPEAPGAEVTKTLHKADSNPVVKFLYRYYEACTPSEEFITLDSIHRRLLGYLSASKLLNRSPATLGLAIGQIFPDARHTRKYVKGLGKCTVYYGLRCLEEELPPPSDLPG